MIETALIKLPGYYRSALYGILDILEFANRLQEPLYQLVLLEPEDLINHQKVYQRLILPPFSREKEMSYTIPGFRKSLHYQIEKGCLPISICAGAFHLCSTGITENKAVTTHWKVAPGLQKKFPRTRVYQDNTVLDQGEYISAGGITSYQDLCLYLINKDLGAQAALQTSRHFIINPQSRSQKPFIQFGETLSSDSIIEKAVRFMKDQLPNSISLKDISDHCNTTIRTLQRRFKQYEDLTPGEYLRYLRIEKAKTLLIKDEEQPLMIIAQACGYFDEASFFRSFKKLTGLSPGKFRKQFRLVPLAGKATIL